MHDPSDGETLFRDVLRYDGFGEHRSGTAGDLATADWLAAELAAAGYDTRSLGLDAPAYSLERCELALAGARVEVMPKWPPQATGAGGVRGTVQPWREDAERLDGALLVFEHDAHGAWSTAAARIEHAAARGAVAALVVTLSESGEIVAQNTPLDATPAPIPVALAGSRHRSLLQQAEGSTATLVLDIVTSAGRARSPLGVIDGRGERWLVVMTPHSGWFHCAGERGCGVAIWLGLARWAARRVRDRNLMFFAGTGHELGMAGEHDFIRGHAPAPEQVDLWVHLGASIGTRCFRSGAEGLVAGDAADPSGYLVADDPLLPVLCARLADYAGNARRVTPDAFLEELAGADAGLRESFNEDDPARGFPYLAALRRGYRPSIALFGEHAFFHTRKDRPLVTGPALLAPVMRALVDAIDAHVTG